MATTEDLTTVLAEQMGTDREVLAICVRRLRAVDYLPDDATAPVDASHAVNLLLAVMGLPLGYAPNAMPEMWGELPLHSASLSFKADESGSDEPVDLEEQYGDCDVWTFGHALADCTRAFQRSDVPTPVVPFRISLSAAGGHPAALLAVSLGVDESGTRATQYVFWEHPDSDEWGRRDDLPACAVETTIGVNAQIMQHLAEALGDHDSERRQPVRPIDTEHAEID